MCFVLVEKYDVVGVNEAWTNKEAGQGIETPR